MHVFTQREENKSKYRRWLSLGGKKESQISISYIFFHEVSKNSIARYMTFL